MMNPFILNVCVSKQSYFQATPICSYWKTIFLLKTSRNFANFQQLKTKEKNSYFSMRCSEKTLGELMKSTCFLFPFNFSSKFLRIKQTCHMVLQLALLWLHFEMELSYCCALIILHATNLQSSLLKFLIKLENQLLQINPQGLD